MTASQAGYVRSSSAFSEKGRRPDNEDSVALDDNLGLFVVADGSGGGGGGALASRMACETVQAVVADSVRRAAIAPPDSRAAYACLGEAISAANRRVLELQGQNPAYKSVASTVVIAWVQNDFVHVSHLGDSRAYLFRGGQLTCLTRDHSLENYLADNPQLKTKVDRAGSTLVKALGLSARTPEPDFRTIQLNSGDVLLLSTDGVSEGLADLLVREILWGVDASSTSEVACSVVRAALAHGSGDNVTAAVIQTRSALSPGIHDGTRQPLGWLAGFEGRYRGEVLPLGPLTTLGASESCQITLGDSFASSVHSEIRAAERGFIVRDLGSTNGTFVNGERISEKRLQDGDVLRIGRTTLVFKSFGA